MTERVEHPVQPSLRRLREFGIRPSRDLGQNFLIDSNLLGVIGRAAELGPDDVVLEVGGGLGVLSEYLAARTRHVHVVELDERLEPALRDALGPAPQRDAAPRRRGPARPRRARRRRRRRSSPTCPTASRRRSSCARSRRSRASTGGSRWSSARSASASPRRRGPRAYGVPSVLAQLACDVRVLRPVSRSVFHPGAERRLGARRPDPPRPGAAAPRCARLVQQGFAHRRKTLARSLALAPGAGREQRDRARAALAAIGRPPATRAEQLAPDEWRALAAALEWTAVTAPAHARAGQAQPLPVRRRPAGGRPAPAGLARPAGDAGRRAAPRAGARPAPLPTRSSARASPARTSRRAALAAYRAASGWDAPPQRLTIVKRVPVAAGMGGGSGDAAAALRLAAHAAGRPGDPLIDELAPALGADVPAQIAPARALVTGAGEHVEPLPARRRRAGLLVLPSAAQARARAAVYPRPTGWGRRAPPPTLARLLDRRPRRRGARRPAPAGARRQRPRAGRPAPVPRDRARARRGAATPARDHAMVSGSGPTVFGVFAGPGGPAAAAAAAVAIAGARTRARSPTAPAGPALARRSAPRGRRGRMRPLWIAGAVGARGLSSSCGARA